MREDKRFTWPGKDGVSNCGTIEDWMRSVEERLQQLKDAMLEQVLTKAIEDVKTKGRPIMDIMRENMEHHGDPLTETYPAETARMWNRESPLFAKLSKTTESDKILDFLNGAARNGYSIKEMTVHELVFGRLLKEAPHAKLVDGNIEVMGPSGKFTIICEKK